MPACGEARQGASRRALTQAIKQHLFADPQTYESIFAEFSTQIQAGLKVGNSTKDGEGVKRIWQVLLSLPNTDEPDAERTEALFAQSLHTLCAVVAQQCLDEADHDRIDEEEVGEEADTAAFDDDTDASAPNAATMRLGAEQFQVRSALARRLRQLTSQWQRSLPAEQRPEDNDWYVMAGVVLEALLKSLADWFTESSSERGHRDGKPHTEKRIQIVQPELAQRLERLIDILPLSFSPQPLKHPVAYLYPHDPGPAHDEAESAIRIDLIGYRQTNGFLRAAHRGLLDPEHRPPNLERYVAAVNVQQAVAWRINRPLLDYARQLIELAHRLDPEQDALGKWIHEQLYRPVKGTRRTFRRPAEFLDNVLARHALEALCPSDPQTEPPAFYLPWKADHRGRIYPETPWFSPQGGDLQRALLEFAHGQVLNEAGASALRRHGANLVKRSRLLTDLGINDRSVLTLDERERWTLSHEADILASAVNPLSEPFWRDVADKPMQFLAFCLAYKHWKDAPDAPIHLPVQIDGTCNGIQHIAALTGDRALAEAVNVLPSADGLPADIYTELAQAARNNLGRLPEPKRHSDHHQGLRLADAWLAADPHPDAWLNRKTAKGVVMTIPYGASRNAQARAVLETIEAQLIEAWNTRPLSSSQLAELDALLNQQKKTRDRPSGADQWTPEDRERERRRAFGLYVSRTLVAHLHDALDKKYPGVSRFSKWLKDCAKACAGTSKAHVGLPILWLTPLGFPVVQNKFVLEKTTRGGLSVQRLTEDVDTYKQQAALLPNLIHSLDATHLMMTLLVANKRGVRDIGSIHDCLLCHPNQAETLAQTVREAFAYLYAPDDQTGLPKPLADWHRWMERVVELRTLPRRGEIIGSLDQPGGFGERILENDAALDQQDAKKALAWLNQFRADTLPTEQWLLRLLLEYACDLRSPASSPSVPAPPVSKTLALSESSISPYFFS